MTVIDLEGKFSEASGTWDAAKPEHFKADGAITEVVLKGVGVIPVYGTMDEIEQEQAKAGASMMRLLSAVSPTEEGEEIRVRPDCLLAMVSTNKTPDYWAKISVEKARQKAAAMRSGQPLVRQ